MHHRYCSAAAVLLIGELAAASGVAVGLFSPTEAYAAEPKQSSMIPTTTRNNGNGDVEQDPEDGFRAFPLVVPHETHYFRAGAEVGGVLAVGFVNYLLFTAASGGLVRQGDQKWALRYDWPELRAKFVGSGYELDLNNYSTNYVWHPFAGTAYFEVARSNHLSFIESALFAGLGSTTWEMFGEIREKVSVNDMIVTPVAGTAIGETMMQLSGFFARSRQDKLHNRIAAVVFSPIKSLNDLLDGSTPRRASDEETDPVLGFPTGPNEPSHRFEVYAGVGFTTQDAPAGAALLAQQQQQASSIDAGFGLDLAVTNLPGYSPRSSPAAITASSLYSSLHSFDDGNVSALHFGMTVSADGRVRDALFSTRVVPIGLYYRTATLDAVTGQHARSQQRAYFGMRAGFEFGSHDFDRDRARSMDFIGLASPIGIAAEHTYEPTARTHVQTGVDLYGAIAAVAPYALTDYVQQRQQQQQQGPLAGLPSTVQRVQYYHAVAVTVSPRIEVKVLGSVVLGGSLRLDVFRPIQGLEAQADNLTPVDRTIEIRDRRVLTKAGVGWEPAFAAPLRFSINGERSTRIGEIGDVHATRAESRATATLGALF